MKIYGSRARGDHRKGSDIDLAFFSESDEDLSSRLSWELDDLPTPYLFDVVNYDKLKNNPLKKEIDQHGKIFYIRKTKSNKINNHSLSSIPTSEVIPASDVIPAEAGIQSKKQSSAYSKAKHSASQKEQNKDSKTKKIKMDKALKKTRHKTLEINKTKQTDIGQIPQDWKVHFIDDIGEVVTGTTPKTSNKAYYGNQYKLISPVDLNLGKYVTTAHRMLSKEGLKQCKILPKNSILVGCIGNVGKIGMTLDVESATNQQINAIICNKQADPHFIFYCLFSLQKRLQLEASQTTIPILNKTNFEKFKIPLPPLEEQKKIAGVLSQIQQAVEMQDKLIKSTTELKKSTMKHLFTYGTENNVIPAEAGIQLKTTFCLIRTKKYGI